MKITEENKSLIFDLAWRIRQCGCQESIQKVKELSDLFVDFDDDPTYRQGIIVFKQSDIEGTQICFTYNGFFYIPSGFTLENVEYHKGVYTFIDTQGKKESASLEALKKVGDNILFGRKKDMPQYIKDIFLHCNELNDTSDYTDKDLGTFIYNNYSNSYECTTKEDCLLDVYADNIGELKELMPLVHRVINNLQQMDVSSRELFIKKYEESETDPDYVLDVRNSHLSMIEFYENEKVVIIYDDIPDAEYDEIIRATFDHELVLTDIEFGYP